MRPGYCLHVSANFIRTTLFQTVKHTSHGCAELDVCTGGEYEIVSRQPSFETFKGMKLLSPSMISMVLPHQDMDGTVTGADMNLVN
jgi:hypothetical protein